jgi:hypothetical protein
MLNYGSFFGMSQVGAKLLKFPFHILSIYLTMLGAFVFFSAMLTNMGVNVGSVVLYCIGYGLAVFTELGWNTFSIPLIRMHLHWREIKASVDIDIKKIKKSLKVDDEKAKRIAWSKWNRKIFHHVILTLFFLGLNGISVFLGGFEKGKDLEVKTEKIQMDSIENIYVDSLMVIEKKYLSIVDHEMESKEKDLEEYREERDIKVSKKRSSIVWAKGEEKRTNRSLRGAISRYEGEIEVYESNYDEVKGRIEKKYDDKIKRLDGSKDKEIQLLDVWKDRQVERIEEKNEEIDMQDGITNFTLMSLWFGLSGGSILVVLFVNIYIEDYNKGIDMDLFEYVHDVKNTPTLLMIGNFLKGAGKIGGAIKNSKWVKEIKDGINNLDQQNQQKTQQEKAIDDFVEDVRKKQKQRDKSVGGETVLGTEVGDVNTTKNKDKPTDSFGFGSVDGNVEMVNGEWCWMHRASKGQIVAKTISDCQSSISTYQGRMIKARQKKNKKVEYSNQAKYDYWVKAKNSILTKKVEQYGKD